MAGNSSIICKVSPRPTQAEKRPGECQSVFLSGRKIGVLGINGRQITLLRIMAGSTRNLPRGFRRRRRQGRYLPQEPVLDDNLDVRGNVMLGVGAKKAISTLHDLAMNYPTRRPMK